MGGQPTTTADPAIPRLAVSIPGHIALPLLMMLSLVQGLIWAWARFGIIRNPPPLPATLTALGATLYKPDRDMLIYVVGAATCIAAGAMLGDLLREIGRLPARATDGANATGAWIELATCLAVATLPLASVAHPDLHLLACLGGLGMVARRVVRSIASSGPLANRCRPIAPAERPETPRWRIRLRTLLADCALPCAVLGLVVFVPWPRLIVEVAYRKDDFHHFDFYVMAPAWAWLHGQRLGAEFYTQYGVGWPLVMACVYRLTGAFNYTTFVRVEVLFGCVYFLGLHLFLRSWLRSNKWAFAGLLMALLLALFMGNEQIAKWLWPSSTVLRFAFDIAFFACLLGHARSGDARHGALAGALLALQILFSTDTGLFMLLAFGAYVVCASRMPSPAPTRRPMGKFILGAVLSLSCVLVAGLSIANQYRLPDEALLSGLTESLRLYGGGIGQLPIAYEVADSPVLNVLLLSMLASYFGSAATAAAACIRCTITKDQAMSATIAVYGMATLLLFVGRSHYQNLMHVTVPFCMLLARTACSLSGLFTGFKASRADIALPDGLSTLLVVLIGVMSATDGYPNVISATAGTAPVHETGPGGSRRSGDVVFSDQPSDTTQFRIASDEIRRAADGGRETVAVIGFADTPYLIDAGVGPYFRYSPVLASLVFTQQRELVERRLVEAPPRWIFISSEPEKTLYGATETSDVEQALLDVVKRSYAFDHAAGPFSVYGRGSEPHGAAAAPP